MNIAISKSTTNSPTHPSSLFPELTLCKTMKDLNQIHANFIKTGKIHDPLAAAEILKISTLSDHHHHRDMQYAEKLFNNMKEPNCFSWNTMIRAFAEGETPLEALLTFHRMVSDGAVEPNRFTFPSVFKACSELKRVDEGKQIHGFVMKLGMECDEFVVSNLVRMYVVCGVMEDAHILFCKNIVRCDDGFRDRKRREDGNVVLWNVMIDGYVRLGEFHAAKDLFDKMPHRSVVSWNGMITGYAQNGHLKEALDIFHEMQISDVNPNYVTLVSVLPAISRLGALELGKWVHLYAKKNEIGIDDVLGSALVDMYSKCGSIDKAVQIFEELPQKNAITWNAIIGGLAMHGLAHDALDHFSKMEQARVIPTDVTYIGILTACSHAGLVNEGRSFFNHMINISGFKPRIEHYGCMVDLLGRAGLLDEAEELIMNMPIKPDDVIWKALLGACKMHGNMEMGERIANHLMKFVPNDSGAYVALSTMHASTGNWENVVKVRLKMKEMYIKKDPGCSWTELDGVIHEFFVEDYSHPKKEDINLMLEEISSQLKSLGYKPDTEQELLNMEEEEKEDFHTHSEKLAVAFGLISTTPQTPIRIVKNLRMCDACHASFKLISKIYERMIVVRDRKRFHHFEDGSCSCRGYW